MNWLEGQFIAEEINKQTYNDLSKLDGPPPSLAIIVVGHNPIIEKFITLKEKLADQVGINLRIHRFPEHIAGNDLRKRLRAIVHNPHTNAVLVQLPFPRHADPQKNINPSTILGAIIIEKDVDGLSSRFGGDFLEGKTLVLPPVVEAVDLLLARYKISPHGKNIWIVGWGRLVGRMLSIWFAQRRAVTGVIPIDKENLPEAILLCKKNLPTADIIVSGVGSPGLIQGEMIKEGAIVIDAGTSEGEEGRLVGDVDIESVSKKATFLTPKTGGLGPIVVALLMRNVVTLTKYQRKKQKYKP